ncbi:MAG: DUF484 family protein [Acidobacteriota bacterium]
MNGHPLLASLLGQLQALERSAREQRVPLLVGQAEALRQAALGLVADRETVEEKALMAALRAEKLEAALERNRKLYEGSLRSFDRFRQGFQLVEELRDLEQLPRLVERLRRLFRVGLMRLSLERVDFEPLLPEGFPLMERGCLGGIASKVLAGEARAYLGSTAQAPAGVLSEEEARRWRSCFVYPLKDRFREGQWAGVLVLADANPQRYRPEMATDYMEHFSDVLANAVSGLAEHKRAENLREDVERIARHDLKSPLSAFLTLPQMLLESDNITGRQKEMIRLMLGAGRRMQNMITLSLSIYRMERGEYGLDARPVDAAGLVRAIWDESGGPYRASDILLELEAQEDPFLVRGEELLCYTMLANLIKNALEASSPGERVGVSLLREDGWDVVEVRNVRDVPEAMRGCLFEKYATHGKLGGTGLGGYSARLIARTHGGDVALHTGNGEGTMVRVRLPRG